MLCTFLLSITPKQVLHIISANHKDQPSKKISDKTEYSQVGFNCDCNSIVATSPFTGTADKIEISRAVDFPVYTENVLVSLSSTDKFYFELRGPPAII